MYRNSEGSWIISNYLTRHSELPDKTKSHTSLHVKIAAKHIAKEEESRDTKEEFQPLASYGTSTRRQKEPIHVMESSDTDTLCYLSLQEQMNIIFFDVHSRTNCRVGGLLNLKMKDVKLDLTRRTLSTEIFSAKNVAHQQGFEPTISCLPRRRTINCATVTKMSKLLFTKWSNE